MKTLKLLLAALFVSTLIIACDSGDDDDGLTVYDPVTGAVVVGGTSGGTDCAACQYEGCTM
ncbi:MAG: hypothetical protein DRQ51_09650 [Gammaproteobacteria bacterium]|nr:MAG: hypothetical protein DRQ51_09650 [Gammaproteobacteria bacterium]